MKYRINNDIKAKFVTVIDENSEPHGKLSLAQALDLAQERGFDLVEVGSSQNPPVCKLLDYGKFMYQINKKQHSSKKKQKQTITKEFKLRPKIATNDLELRLRRGSEFLADGYKVKYTMQYRGREDSLTYLGNQLFQTLIEKLSEVGDVEVAPVKAMNQHYLIMAPKKATKVEEGKV